MTANLQNPIFTDDAKAREWLEARVWPNGPVCPHCGATGDDVTALKGKAHRPGLYQCAACREQFTVTVKTVFERSKIPLSKWLAALFLLTASKKGVSAHQVHRSLDISYKSAWFMMHRLREALRQGGLAPMGGPGKIVEADETFIGTKEGFPKRLKGVGNKMTVMSLVERGGPARSVVLDGLSRGDVEKMIRQNVHHESKLMTDSAAYYRRSKFGMAHEMVDHSIGEYGRGEVHTNTVEGYYSIFKRGMKGVYTDNQGICLGYIRGFTEGLYLGISEGRVYERSKMKDCLPTLQTGRDPIDVTQAELIIKKFLVEHPDRLNEPALTLALEALLKGFHCYFREE